jgi:hypothetical protein
VGERILGTWMKMGDATVLLLVDLAKERPL